MEEDSELKCYMTISAQEVTEKKQAETLDACTEFLRQVNAGGLNRENISFTADNYSSIGKPARKNGQNARTRAQKCIRKKEIPVGLLARGQGKQQGGLHYGKCRRFLTRERNPAHRGQVAEVRPKTSSGVGPEHVPV